MLRRRLRQCAEVCCNGERAGNICAEGSAGLRALCLRERDALRIIG